MALQISNSRCYTTYNHLFLTLLFFPYATNVLRLALKMHVNFYSSSYWDVTLILTALQFSRFYFSRKEKGREMVNKTTIRMLNSHPVLSKKLFSSSHLFICKHPFENPNNPPFIFWNGWQGDFKLPTSYSNWSCKEPPTLILKGLRAIKQPLWKEWYHTCSKYSKHVTNNKSIFSIRKSQNRTVEEFHYSDWFSTI